MAAAPPQTIWIVLLAGSIVLSEQLARGPRLDARARILTSGFAALAVAVAWVCASGS
jgi:hypothetical protein